MKTGRIDRRSSRRAFKPREAQAKAHRTAELLAEARREIQNLNLLLAEQRCEEALAYDSHSAEGLHLLGVITAQTGQNERGVQLIREALAIQPEDPMAHTNLAVALHALGRDCEALDHLHRAYKLEPRSGHTLRNCAVILADQGRWPEAGAYLREWLSAEPDNADVYRWIGDWHSRQQQREQAVPFYLKSLELDPGDADAANNLGACLADTGRHESALALLCKMVELNPNHAGAWGNLGVAAKNFGDVKTALDCCDRALALAPGDAKALWNRALCLLGLGRLEEGWKELDWRLKSGAVPRVPIFERPQWEGSDPAGKTILLWAEQGLGDQILFFSMVPDLLRAGAHCIVECDWRLVKLLERSLAGAEIVPMCEPLHPRMRQPDIDFQTPVASLARWFRPTIASFPTKRGYLTPDPEKAAHWRERLARVGEGLKVGICWRSGMTGRGRSFYYSQINQWRSILTVPGIAFVNLQYGECREELQEAEHRFGAHLHTWDDLDLKKDQEGLAALMSGLDLVISAGTAVDSLAGALGCATWVLARSIGDWWALGTDYCPWNPMVRPFLCAPSAPWEPTIEVLAAELARMRDERRISGVMADAGCEESVRT